MFCKEQVFNLHRWFDMVWHTKNRKKNEIKVRDHFIQHDTETGAFSVSYCNKKILHTTQGGFDIDLGGLGGMVWRRSRATRIINHYMHNAGVHVTLMGYGNCHFIVYGSPFLGNKNGSRYIRGLAGHYRVEFATGTDGRVRQVRTDCGKIDDCDCQFISRNRMLWMNKLHEVRCTNKSHEVRT